MSDTENIKQEVKDVRKNYTRTPNILFESYPELRPQEKWLYINLVYLCGKKGTRHLSLRYISQRTGISLGTLSGSKNPEKDPGMIRHLHNSGLIHAEIKKKRLKDGKETDQAQYHITITDIWQLNEAFFLKRSESEHLEDNENTGVRNLNASVRKMNTQQGERSESERERSEFDTNIRLHSKTTDSSKTTESKIESDVADANRTPTPSSFSLEVPRLTLPQRDNTQARMDEAEQNLIYMDLPPNVKSEIIYLTEQKYYTVRLKRSAYDGEEMTFFIVTDPYTQEENTYRTETFLKFVDVLRQHSSELKRLSIAHEVQNIIDDALGPGQTRFPEPPPSTPAIPETTPLQPENSPILEEPVKDTAESATMPISASPSQREASSEDEMVNEQSGVPSSHSQGALRNGTPAETPEPGQPAGRGKGSGKGKSREGEPTKEQISHVFDTINEVLRKIYGKPEFSVVESEKAVKAVKSLIKAKASPALVKLVIKDMWGDYRNGEYWWRGRGRMTVPAICEQYSSRAPSLASKLVTEHSTVEASPVPVSSQAPSRPFETPFQRDLREKKAQYLGKKESKVN